MSFSGGDVVLNDFSLSGVQVASRVSEFSIFENVLKPYVSIVATIVDATDMINHNADLTRTTLSVSVGQPGQDPYTATFAVTSVERARSSSNQRVAYYTITGYSPHMTRHPSVQRAYRSSTAVDAAADVVRSFLQPIKPVVVGTQSRGLLGNDHMPFNLNGVGVHQAIRTLLDRAVESAQKATFVLFESRRALVIDSLEALLEKSLSNPVMTYHQRPLGHDFMRDRAEQNRVILSMREESRGDKTDQLLAETQQTSPFDVFSHSNERSGSSQAASLLGVLYDSMRPPTWLSEGVPTRQRTASDFDSQALTIQVALNPAITVGGGFGVELNSPMGDTASPVRSKLSGALMATEVRHTVRLGVERVLQGVTTVRGTRGGV